MPASLLPVDPQEVVDRLKNFQERINSLVRRRAAEGDPASVARASQADTIYAIDAAVEPEVEAFCREWSQSTPLVLIAEGLVDEHGQEGAKVFPKGTSADAAMIRVILDPIDGTRGFMYDKRSAWSLAGVAPNRRPATSLRDIEVAVMTELPTTKQSQADVLWAIRGRGARGERIDRRDGTRAPLSLRPSAASTINHGFASVSNFFPGTKVLAAQLIEFLVENLIGEADITRATVFDDQYISTAGQWHELIAGHDRFNADLRPAFYRMQGRAEGMCCHPYDCAALLVAEEAGVIITDEHGRPLDAPLDTTSGVSWLGYANATLRQQIEPLVGRFLREGRLQLRGAGSGDDGESRGYLRTEGSGVGS